MPDLNSHADIEEPITLDEGSENASTEESSQQEPQKEKPATLADVRNLLQQEFIPQINSTIQSQTAKGENRINQNIKERFAALEKNKGVLKLTDEQVQVTQQEIIREEQMNAYQPQPQISGEGQTPSNVPVNYSDFVYEQIGAVLAETGVEITLNDPEGKIIQKALDDPKGSLAKTLLAANKAAQAKATRVAAQQKNASARVTSTGGEQNSDPNDIANITDTTELYERGDALIRKGKK